MKDDVPYNTGLVAAPMNLVLVGGGHAHIEVLRRWSRAPLAGVDLTLIVDRPRAVYSGMVPGFVAGDYRCGDIEIDVVALARAAGARVVEAAATSLDPARRSISLATYAAADAAGAPAATVSYDVASLDVGSSVRGLELPGVREHALATRPIGDFIGRVGEAVEACVQRSGSSVRVVVVGGGAAGFELAFTLGSRIRRSGVDAQILVVSESGQGMAGCTPRAARSIEREAARFVISVVHGRRACAVDEAGVRLVASATAQRAADESRIDADLVVWATGPAPPPVLAASRQLPLDARGFLRVRSSLQVPGYDDLFAVGDCASMDAAPWVPKAGVYAVRQGPVLDANLRAYLSGRRPRAYRPQRDFLSILNLGDGRALAIKGWVAVSGRLAWLLKDRIDRRFMLRYRRATQPLPRIL